MVNHCRWFSVVFGKNNGMQLRCVDTRVISGRNWRWNFSFVKLIGICSSFHILKVFFGTILSRNLLFSRSTSTTKRLFTTSQRSRGNFTSHHAPLWLPQAPQSKKLMQITMQLESRGKHQLLTRNKITFCNLTSALNHSELFIPNNSTNGSKMKRFKSVIGLASRNMSATQQLCKISRGVTIIVNMKPICDFWFPRTVVDFWHRLDFTQIVWNVQTNKIMQTNTFFKHTCSAHQLHVVRRLWFETCCFSSYKNNSID